MTPNGLHDLSGWSQISCTDRDRLAGEFDLSPASSLTDPDGVYGSPVVFTEWWLDHASPILRDYRYPHTDRPCSHYRATDASAAHEDEESA